MKVIGELIGKENKLSNVRFIADLHVGHHNMVTGMLGFRDVYHHQEHLIEQWNSVVHKKDMTYILGDVTMESNEYTFLDRLNGNKVVVMGNHDRRQYVPELLQYVGTVAGMVKYSDKRYGRIWLTHCPIHPMEMDKVARVRYNIHGHIHSGYKIDDPRYICVCAEQIDYKPKLLSELNIKLL